jgi:hypothetical protein
MEVNKNIQAVILSVFLIIGVLINASYAAKEQVNVEEFKILSLVFCSEQPTNFKEYKEQPNATYNPTDTVWIYGDTNHITLNENSNGTKEMWMAINLRVRAPDGRIFDEGEYFNQHINVPAETDPEKFWFDVLVGPPTRFEEGKYSVELEVTDKLAEKTAKASSIFTISTTAPSPMPLTITPTPIVTPTPKPTPSPTITATETPTPEEGVPGFETVSAIAGLLAGTYLFRLRGKQSDH